MTIASLALRVWEGHGMGPSMHHHKCRANAAPTCSSSMSSMRATGMPHCMTSVAVSTALCMAAERSGVSGGKDRE